MWVLPALELYSDGLGTISQFIAIKFGPQLPAGIHMGVLQSHQPGSRVATHHVHRIMSRRGSFISNICVAWRPLQGSQGNSR